jgi:hypothetical protein
LGTSRSLRARTPRKRGFRKTIGGFLDRLYLILEPDDGLSVRVQPGAGGEFFLFDLSIERLDRPARSPQ